MDYIITPNGDFISTDELYHWGIKGMKWGVRRYQNKDGTLTDAGKKRVSEKNSETSNKTTAVKGEIPKEVARPSYLEMFEDEMRSGAKGLLYEYVKAQKARWESEGTESENAASEKLVSAYAKLKADYLKRTASESAMQFLKDNPKVLTSTTELMKTDFNDPRRKEYIEYDVDFEGSLDNLYETDSFYEYMNDELHHWGIKGMKWGQRRYQNKDGSLTPAGKKRYAKEGDGDGDKSAAKPKQKSLSEMSDDEIRSAIARKQLENAYRQYHPEPEKPESFAKKFVEQAVKPAAINAGRDFIEKALKKATGDLLKDKVDPNSLAGLEAANKKLAAQIENKLLKEGINPNIKGENLEKILNFNERLASKKQEKKSGKTTKDSDKTTDSAEATKERAKNAKEEPRTTRTKQEKPPKVTVEGPENSRKKNTENRTKPDPIIIDMDMGVSDLPAVYTEYGRDYVDLAVYGYDRRGGG